jgi:predicted DNA-binding protein
MQQGKQFEFSLKIGKELSEELYLLTKQTKKWSLDEIKDMIEQYKDKLKEFS